MAKGNLFLGTARGRVGSVVFRRRNGQQVTSVRTSPTNPKSEAQCKQRMVFATSVSAAARLRTIVDHSFEGIRYGQDSVNYFTKLNTPMLRAGMSYDGESEMPDPNNYLVKGAKGLARMPFQISRGQLSFPQYAWATSFDESSTETEIGAELQGVQFGVLATEIQNASEYATVLSHLGIQPGEQLTLVAGLTDHNMDAEYAPTGAVNYTTYVEYARIIFKPAQDIDFSTPFKLVDAESSQFNSLVVNYERSSNWIDKVYVEISTAGNAIIAPMTNGLDLVMIALIRSARGASGWLRSSAKFVLGDESDALAWQVWPSYGKQESVGTSHRYLNQAYNRSDETPNDEMYAPVIESFTVASPAATSIAISAIETNNFTTTPRFVAVEVKNAAGVILVSDTYPFDATITATTTAELVEGQTYSVKLTIQGVSKTQQYTKKLLMPTLRLTWNEQQVVNLPVTDPSLDPPLGVNFQGGVWQSGAVLRIEFDDMSVNWNEEVFFSDAMSQCVNASSAIGTVQHTVTFEANACVITFTTDEEGDVYFPRISEKSIVLGANSGGAAITITD